MLASQHERTQEVVSAVVREQHVATRAANVNLHEATQATIAQGFHRVTAKVDEVQDSVDELATDNAHAKIDNAHAKIAKIAERKLEREAQNARDSLLVGIAETLPRLEAAVQMRPHSDTAGAKLAKAESEKAAFKATGGTAQRGETAEKTHVARMLKCANDGAATSATDAKRPAGAKTAASANIAAGSPHSRGRAL